MTKEQRERQQASFARKLAQYVINNGAVSVEMMQDGDGRTSFYVAPMKPRSGHEGDEWISLCDPHEWEL